jgi:hypothetical protein
MGIAKWVREMAPSAPCRPVAEIGSPAPCKAAFRLKIAHELRRRTSLGKNFISQERTLLVGKELY